LEPPAGAKTLAGPHGRPEQTHRFKGAEAMPKRWEKRNISSAAGCL